MNVINVCGASDTGVKRDKNQDHYLIGATVAQSCQWSLAVRTSDPDFISRGLICAVADGMGGHVGGAKASRLALEIIAAGSSSERDPDGIWLSRLIIQTHDTLLQRADADPELYNMGTTIAGVHLSPGSCTAFHAGDSRLYRLRDNYLNQITEDHTLQADSPLNGTAPVGRRSSVLTNALGGGGNSKCVPSVQTGVSFRVGDSLLLCSDGLTDAVTDIAALEEVLRAETPLEQRVEALIEAANRAGAPDNVTVILIEGN